MIVFTNSQTGGGTKPAEKTTTRHDLLAQTVESYRVEYEELTADWRAIEGKAQALITVVGIFTAASLAFLENFNLGLYAHQRVVLVLAIASLVVGLVCCLFALRVLTVTPAPRGRKLEELTETLLEETTDDEAEERLERHQGSLLTGWYEANDDLYTAVNYKSTWVFRAQVSLIVAVALFGLLSVTIVVDPQSGVENEASSPQLPDYGQPQP